MPKRGRARETSLPFVTVDPHLDSHPRMLALIDMLADYVNIPETMIPDVIAVRLWRHAGRSAIDGCLGVLSPRSLRRIVAHDIEVAPDILYGALTDHQMGLLAVDDNGALHIHDWADHGGQLQAKRDAWREAKANKAKAAADRRAKESAKKARQRARKADLSPGTRGGQGGDVPGTGAGQVRDSGEMSPLEKCNLQSENNDLDFSRGKLADIQENSPPKAKGKGKRKSLAEPAFSEENFSEQDRASELVAIAPPDWPPPNGAERGKLSQLEITDQAWKWVCEYTDKRQCLSKWAYAARRALDPTAHASPTAKTRHRPTQPQQQTPAERVCQLVAMHGLARPDGDVLDRLISLDLDEPIDELLAVYVDDGMTSLDAIATRIDRDRRAEAREAMADLRSTLGTSAEPLFCE